MSTIKANDIQSASGGIPTVKGQRLIPTAWVNFNGTGTVAIRDSENVSSITDNAAGDYDVNFASSMDNANYSITGSAHRSGGDNNAGMCVHGGSDPTTASVRIAGRYPTTSNAKDYSSIFVVILGGQA